MLDALGILPQRKQHKKLLLVSCHDDYSIFITEGISIYNLKTNFVCFNNVINLTLKIVK